MFQNIWQATDYLAIFRISRRVSWATDVFMSFDEAVWYLSLYHATCFIFIKKIGFTMIINIVVFDVYVGYFLPYFYPFSIFSSFYNYLKM